MNNVRCDALGILPAGNTTKNKAILLMLVNLTKRCKKILEKIQQINFKTKSYRGFTGLSYISAFAIFKHLLDSTRVSV